MLAPRPAAVVSIAGYGDLTDLYGTPSQHHVSELQAASEREARRAVGTATISESGPSDSMQFYTGRGLFYLFCVQQGIWLSEVSGHDPDDQNWFVDYQPCRNVSADYPPTMLLHGELDTDVPIGQSELMQQEFIKHGVAHKFIRGSNWGHAFLYMPNDKTVGEAFDQIVRFLEEHV